MKKIALLIPSLLIFLACDKVEHPNQNISSAFQHTCPFVPHVLKTDSNTTKVAHRIVLVEDYTGHTCGNCPRAAEDAEVIMNKYKDSVVVIAVHAGTQFAPPQMPEYPDDYRSEAGTEWDTYFGLSGSGLPKGMVNRAQTPFPQQRNTWNGLVGAILDNTPSAKIELSTAIDTADLFLKVDVKTTFLKAWANPVKLVVIVTEDSIISHQKDYGPIPPSSNTINGDERTDYVFNHMMRGAVNSTWGDNLKTGAVVNDVVRKSYSCYKLNPWLTTPGNPKKNLKNTAVVAYAYDDVTKEILQVDKLYIK